MKSAGTEGHTWTERSDKEHRLSVGAQLTHRHRTLPSDMHLMYLKIRNWILERSDVTD